MAELLTIFVVGEPKGPSSVLWCPTGLVMTLSPLCFPTGGTHTHLLPIFPPALKLCVHWLGLLSCQPARGWGRQPKHPRPASPTSLSSYVVAETAVRSIRQAQAEDLALVDVDQLEKVLPQLVGGLILRPALPGAGLAPTGSECCSPPQLLDF